MTTEEDFQRGVDNLYRPAEWPGGFLDAVRQLVRIGSDLSRAGLSVRQALVEAQNVYDEVGDGKDGFFHSWSHDDNLSDVNDVRVWGRGNAWLASVGDDRIRGALEHVKQTMEPLVLHDDWHGDSYVDDYKDEVLRRVQESITGSDLGDSR